MILMENARHETATDELREWVLLYGLGMLDPDLTSGFREHLNSGCAVCISEAREFGDAVAQTVYAMPEAAPGPRVRETLMAQTRVMAQTRAGQPTPRRRLCGRDLE